MSLTSMAPTEEYKPEVTFSTMEEMWLGRSKQIVHSKREKNPLDQNICGIFRAGRGIMRILWLRVGNINTPPFHCNRMIF